MSLDKSSAEDRWLLENVPNHTPGAQTRTPVIGDSDERLVKGVAMSTQTREAGDYAGADTTTHDATDTDDATDTHDAPDADVDVDVDVDGDADVDADGL